VAVNKTLKRKRPARASIHHATDEKEDDDDDGADAKGDASKEQEQEEEEEEKRDTKEDQDKAKDKVKEKQEDGQSVGPQGRSLSYPVLALTEASHQSSSEDVTMNESSATIEQEQQSSGSSRRVSKLRHIHIHHLSVPTYQPCPRSLFTFFSFFLSFFFWFTQVHCGCRSPHQCGWKRGRSIQTRRW
jgi:hypothetical protein